VESADLEMVGLIAALHDVDDRKLSPETCENLDHARTFLHREGVPSDRIEWILHGIRQISFKGTDSVSPDSIEAKCVQDADRLDAIGAIGIARTFAFGGSHGRSMHDPQDKTSSIAHFYDKLLLLKDRMNTETGRRLAQHRHEFLESYLAEFLAEWDGKR
jgi:uncharacterized protein